MTDKDPLDTASFLGEIKRFARTSGTVGGIATRLIGNKLGLKSDHAGHANALRLALGALKGPLMKGAQILSTIPGALPDEYAQQLAELQANAPPMGWSFVRRRMASELGPDWERLFQRFSQEAAAAASLGQVHRALTMDGREVACKLQYPNMRATVEFDLKQFKLAVGVLQRVLSAIRQDQVVAELEARLREELDYIREAAHMRLYRDMLRDQPRITVPDVVPELSTGRLLTMQWVNGTGIQKFLDTNPSQEARNDVARALFYAWYTPVYRYGIIHGDPHMGNFTVRADHGLNLLDFGAIRIFPPHFVKAIIDLFAALQRDDETMAFEAYAGWGFSDLSRETARVLNEWAKFVYGPLLDNRERLIQEDDDPNFGRDIAERVYEGLKRTGGVRPSREFVLIDRSAIGLGSVFVRLKAKLNWHQMFHELIKDFDVHTLSARQEAALARAEVPPPLSSL